MDNAVHLWDMRLSGKVRQFALHKNSSLPSVGLAVSPEGERIAVGSEDRSIYLYDVRQGSTPLDVISTGNGVPLALAWNPLDPVLCAGLSSGEVLFYGQK
ncbi:hypothetical protein ADEAN_000555200 [Angomonas deanei]|uniref:Uncharacterized protein n=1 Tax=Angomonas deanei TaxID=59799 RepID=A0A7G2CE07_9TRYP|nr:hypothetical protein ADEAN_000555200 [Angomonas deanei]